jgi:hypothetical protein
MGRNVQVIWGRRQGKFLKIIKQGSAGKHAASQRMADLPVVVLRSAEELRAAGALAMPEAASVKPKGKSKS